MSLQTSDIRNELAHHFNAAFDYAGGCTQHQREDAHYERGRKDGIGLALELVDTFLCSEDEHPGRRRAAEEIAADQAGAGTSVGNIASISSSGGRAIASAKVATTAGSN
jgi:hypothetical protein